MYNYLAAGADFPSSVPLRQLSASSGLVTVLSLLWHCSLLCYARARAVSHSLSHWTAEAQETPPLHSSVGAAWFGLQWRLGGGREGGGCHCMVVTSSPTTDCNIAIYYKIAKLKKPSQPRHWQYFSTSLSSNFVKSFHNWEVSGVLIMVLVVGAVHS